MATGPQNLGNVVTSPRDKSRQANLKKGTISKSRAAAPKTSGLSGSGTGGGTHASVNLPQLVYSYGPFELPVLDYEFRLWARGQSQKVIVSMEEIEAVDWDDASALVTGSVTFREAEWAKRLGIAEGNQITCECRDEFGVWQGLWTMRVYSPGKDYSSKQRTFNLANEFQRLQDSTDTFKFVKDKAKPSGWRADEAIKFILDKYGIEIGPGGLPRMRAMITNWTVIDQSPLDVIHSILLREKKKTGIKYSLRLDAQSRAVIATYARPMNLYQMGPMLFAATYSVSRNPRFATDVSIYADPISSSTLDAKGRAKTVHAKLLTEVATLGGIQKWGIVHRNLYSPDAKSTADANDEGSMFLSSVARGTPQFTVTMAGMPFLRRLDAVRFILPADGLRQVVYVSETHHKVDSGQYTTDTVWNVDDPFVDRKADMIAAKLSDVAITKSRKGLGGSKTVTSTTKNKKTVPKPPLGNIPTNPGKPTKTGGKK